MIGESMAVIAKRYLKDGYTVEETAKIIQHPVEFVKMVKSTLVTNALTSGLLDKKNHK